MRWGIFLVPCVTSLPRCSEGVIGASDYDNPAVALVGRLLWCQKRSLQVVRNYVVKIFNTGLLVSVRIEALNSERKKCYIKIPKLDNENYLCSLKWLNLRPVFHSCVSDVFNHWNSIQHLESWVNTHSLNCHVSFGSGEWQHIKFVNIGMHVVT